MNCVQYSFNFCKSYIMSDKSGFYENGIHRKTGTLWDTNGFDKKGIHRETGLKHDQRWFNKTWEHETGSFWDTNGLDVNWNYNPMFDKNKKQKSDDLCTMCTGLWKINMRSSLHQYSDAQNYEILCPKCRWTGKKEIEK